MTVPDKPGLVATAPPAMSRFFQALRRAAGSRAGGPGVEEADVYRWGLTGQRAAAAGSGPGPRGCPGERGGEGAVTRVGFCEGGGALRFSVNNLQASSK